MKTNQRGKYSVDNTYPFAYTMRYGARIEFCLVLQLVKVERICGIDYRWYGQQNQEADTQKMRLAGFRPRKRQQRILPLRSFHRVCNSQTLVTGPNLVAHSEYSPCVLPVAAVISVFPNATANKSPNSTDQPVNSL